MNRKKVRGAQLQAAASWLGGAASAGWITSRAGSRTHHLQVTGSLRSPMSHADYVGIISRTVGAAAVQSDGQTQWLGRTSMPPPEEGEFSAI